jgi:isoquinoline 1-oxidoreductase subunit alpha
VRLTLTLNGAPVSFDADPQMPLLWALRDVIGLKGTKFGCGQALCGACTVLVDGEPLRACVTAVGDVTGSVTTIEGIAQGGTLSAVQQAWETLNVMQCGYCQSGQILAATALLAANPEPDDAAIDAALDGNLCRCGTYPKIREGIKLAAALMKPKPAKGKKAPAGGKKAKG